jgi:hypothetical protein
MSMAAENVLPAGELSRPAKRESTVELRVYSGAEAQIHLMSALSTTLFEQVMAEPSTYQETGLRTALAEEVSASLMALADGSERYSTLDKAVKQQLEANSQALLIPDKLRNELTGQLADTMRSWVWNNTLAGLRVEDPERETLSFATLNHLIGQVARGKMTRDEAEVQLRPLVAEVLTVSPAQAQITRFQESGAGEAARSLIKVYPTGVLRKAILEPNTTLDPSLFVTLDRARVGVIKELSSAQKAELKTMTREAQTAYSLLAAMGDMSPTQITRVLQDQPYLAKVAANLPYYLGNSVEVHLSAPLMAVASVGQTLQSVTSAGGRGDRLPSVFLNEPTNGRAGKVVSGAALLAVLGITLAGCATPPEISGTPLPDGDTDNPDKAFILGQALLQQLLGQQIALADDCMVPQSEAALLSRQAPAATFAPLLEAWLQSASETVGLQLVCEPGSGAAGDELYYLRDGDGILVFDTNGTLQPAQIVDGKLVLVHELVPTEAAPVMAATTEARFVIDPRAVGGLSVPEDLQGEFLRDLQTLNFLQVVQGEYLTGILGLDEETHYFADFDDVTDLDAKYGNGTKTLIVIDEALGVGYYTISLDEFRIAGIEADDMRINEVGELEALLHGEVVGVRRTFPREDGAQGAYLMPMEILDAAPDAVRVEGGQAFDIDGTVVAINKGSDEIGSWVAQAVLAVAPAAVKQTVNQAFDVDGNVVAEFDAEQNMWVEKRNIQATLDAWISGEIVVGDEARFSLNHEGHPLGLFENNDPYAHQIVGVLLAKDVVGDNLIIYLGCEDKAASPEGERDRFTIALNVGKLSQDEPTGYLVRPSGVLFGAGAYNYQFLSVRQLDDKINGSLGEVVLVTVFYNTDGIDISELDADRQQLMAAIVGHEKAGGELGDFMYKVIEGSVIEFEKPSYIDNVITEEGDIDSLPLSSALEIRPEDEDEQHTAD